MVLIFIGTIFILILYFNNKYITILIMATFLISPKFIREHSNISANIQDKFLEGAVREATDIDLRTILGNCLLEHLKSLIEPDSENHREIDDPENEIYKELIDQSKYYLLYNVVARILPICSIKIDNMGSFKTEDDRIESIDTDDMFQLMNYYQHRAEYYMILLQKFLVEHEREFPELQACDCKRLHAHIKDGANSTGLWLGGYRGRTLQKDCEC